MRVILNEQGYVESYALIGSFGAPSIEVAEPEDIIDFENNYGSYYLSHGMLVKSADRQIELEDERLLHDLRLQREKACFPYINRGYLWYSKLTEEQKIELEDWYQAWLDVTDTKVSPVAPEWLV
jgi:hypothetical protein